MRVIFRRKEFDNRSSFQIWFWFLSSWKSNFTYVQSCEKMRASCTRSNKVQFNI